MNRAVESTEDLETAQFRAGMRQMQALETMEAYNSVLSQSQGLLSMAVGNMEQLGYVTEEQSEKFRNAQATLELLLVPLEIFLMFQNFAIARSMAHTSALGGQTAATGAATTATWGFNTALYANPIVLVVAAVVTLIAALYLLERKFNFINRTMDDINEAFAMWVDSLKAVIDSIETLASKADVIGDIGDRVTGVVRSYI